MVPVPAQRELRSVRHLVVVLGAAASGALWMVAALHSPRPMGPAIVLALLQALLFGAASLMLVGTLRPARSWAGYGVAPILALHVLLHYGFSNIVPALFPGIRTSMTLPTATWRIPVADLEYYCLGTGAAVALVVGAWAGCAAGRRLLPDRNSLPGNVGRPCRVAWLPSYRLALWACAAMLVVASLGTLRYGLQWTTAMTQAHIDSLPLAEKLLFHGLSPFLPAAPIVAAAAVVQASSRRQKRNAYLALVAAAAVSLGLLMAWRMRSTAMMALAAPIALLVYTGTLRWRRVLLPTVVLIVLAYVVVTSVRASGLTQLLAASGTRKVSVTEVVQSLRERSVQGSVRGWALLDLSYRTAGLEGVAAILEAQSEGRVGLKWGAVTTAGFKQALPALLRRGSNFPERLKTAPAHYGLFAPGDWVTTILAEAVLDWGPLLTLFAAFGIGLILECVDRSLLWLSQIRVLRGLGIIRFAWLFELFVFEWGIADVTLRFAKGILGYAVFFVVLAYATQALAGLTPRRRTMAVGAAPLVGPEGVGPASTPH